MIEVLTAGLLLITVAAASAAEVATAPRISLRRRHHCSPTRIRLSDLRRHLVHVADGETARALHRAA